MPPKGYIKTDLTGKIFNKLTVISLDHRTSNGINVWKCSCSCGNTTLAYQFQLGKKESCGCQNRHDSVRDDKIGKKLGFLTCLSFEFVKNESSYYKYKCDCGGIIITQGNSVKSGATQSCGCLYKKTRPKKKIFISSGESLKDFIEDKDISMTHAFEVFKKTGEDGLKNLLINRSLGHNQTALEFFVSNKLNISFFNKKSLSKYGYKADFKLNDLIYMNCDGLYYHSNNKVPNDYHFKMRESYEKEDKRILQFYADEVYNKWNIVNSIINNAIGKTPQKIFARKCELRSVGSEEMESFFKENHLMDNMRAARGIGLFFDNKLVSCASYRISVKKSTMEIARFGSVLNTVVIGGFQKLLAALEDIAELNNIKQLKSFCDLRYATGTSYEKAGFKRVSVTQGWCWTYGNKRFNRLMCKAENGKSEAEVALERKWSKIYDAGQAKYIKVLI